jgi:hypothetical protein
MTSGICIPVDATRQVELIDNLGRMGIAGIAVGDDMKGPPLTDAMLAEADGLHVPVLTVSHSSPFSALGRTVAIAAQSEQIEVSVDLRRAAPGSVQARYGAADRPTGRHRFSTPGAGRGSLRHGFCPLRLDRGHIAAWHEGLLAGVCFHPHVQDELEPAGKPQRTLTAFHRSEAVGCMHPR